MMKQAQEAAKKRQEEEKKKQEEEAFNALPEEEKQKIQKIKDAEAEKNKGNEFYKKKDFNNAIAHYDKAIELNPSEVNYLNNKAAVYFEMKDYSKCIEQCDQAIKVSKGGHYDYIKLGKALARKGNALAQMGQFDESIDFYQQALLENNDYNTREGLKKVEKMKKEHEA